MNLSTINLKWDFPDFSLFCNFVNLYFYHTVLPDDYIDTVVDSLSVLNVTDNYCTAVYFTILGGAVKEIADGESPFLFKKAK